MLCCCAQFVVKLQCVQQIGRERPPFKNEEQRSGASELRCLSKFISKSTDPQLLKTWLHLITWLKLNIKTAWAKKEQLAEAMMTSILSLPTSDIPEKFWHLVKCKCLKTPIKFHSLFKSKEFTQDLKFICQVPQTPLEQVMIMLSNPDFMPCPIGRSPGHPSLSKLESSEHALEPSFSDDSQCSVSRGSTWWGPGLPG